MSKNGVEYMKAASDQVSCRGRRSGQEERVDLLTQARGTDAPWYKGWELTDEERDVFRKRSQSSRKRKLQALSGEGPAPIHSVNVPRLDPYSLMPQLRSAGIRSLSLFSGGGGFDVGFDRAGFDHVASYELLADAAQTLQLNRPKWNVFGGNEGDVRKVNWRLYKGKVDLIHGGPPCQPFSSSGRQLGKDDVRDMWPEFVRAVMEIQPATFVAENVPALQSMKFRPYVQSTILNPLGEKYKVSCFEISAESVGIPQVRRRIIFLGFRDERAAKSYIVPEPTHRPFGADSAEAQGARFNSDSRPHCSGVRHALGLPDIGFDALAPTLRSALTGPRHTTSVVSSVSAHRIWDRLGIWPNGVALTREDARAFVAKNGGFRLAVPDCALIQGFPKDWKFFGAVYMVLGQIGNAVAPPVGYALAKSVRKALLC